MIGRTVGRHGPGALAFGLVMLGSLALDARVIGAQQTARVEVRDDQGAPVGYALVAPVGGTSQVASDSGVVTVRMRAADSLNLRVRRIGYREHFGWVARVEGGAYRVTLPRVAATLSAVEVTAAGSSSNTVLSQRGFYERVDRVQKGAILADFLTPEQLDERQGFTKVTQMIAGSRYARVNSLSGGSTRVLVIVGRGGCPMNILLDGQLVRGTAQDVAVSEVPQSINPNGTRQSGNDSMAAKVSIDDVVDGRSIMALEIYSNTANAPAELVRVGGRGSCGIVALWTGARR
ncbi:MAG: hypothetical protein IPJ78_15990 [Gemmatimonadetes bacterium]|nr:hypothetical protein [Gemmatimonadota bacterium]